MLHYHPGGRFLQICTIGCNFRCSGCVSWIPAQKAPAQQAAIYENLAEVADRALGEGCAGPLFRVGCFRENSPPVRYSFRLIRYCSHPLFFSHAVSSLSISSHDPGTISVK